MTTQVAAVMEHDSAERSSAFSRSQAHLGLHMKSASPRHWSDYHVARYRIVMNAGSSVA